MEMRHLRYAIAAAEHGSFRRAAVALGVQESAISRRIRDLENEIGIALFIRHCGGVCLTNAGHRFIGSTRRAVDCIGKAVKDAGTMGRGEIGVVRIGILAPLGSGFLADLLKAYSRHHAGVRLHFVEAGQPAHLPAIRRHQLDVAFLVGEPTVQDCDVAHLWNERVYVVMSKNDVLADVDVITWDHLRDRHFVVPEASPGPEIQDYLVKNLAQPGYRPSIERQDVYRDTLMQIVAGGRGLTLTCEASVAASVPGAAFRPLKGEVVPFCAIWSPKNDNPAFRRLLSLAKLLSKRRAFHSPKTGPSQKLSLQVSALSQSHGRQR